jgi:predicted Ser/Thr protein kinase
MADEQGERAWAVFDQLAEVPAEQREAVLQAACGDDRALRAEVERLLAVDDGLATPEHKAGFLQSPLLRTPGLTELAPGPARPPQGEVALPHHIGRYRVLRLLGEGGMGAVYEAEQDSPHRRVALKVIRPGLLAPALLKRFAQEVEILGRLHHPGIAQIYEAGGAQDGQPFFAMEFIRGLPLDEHARLRALPLPARVEMLARVCDAVQHAHDQGVIHRDLKPANILVEENGQPKVLDFGVARATDADLVSGAGLTRTGQLLGTPSYMSPEQVTADPAAIDHRADVYALGVILFELLAHRLPYRLENRPLAEAARLILEEEPPRLGSLNPELRGDVETIVAKALAKEPARRYPSAAELAADLRRWLAHEPIQARPPSALYYLRKFARRHKALVAGGVATVVALVLGLIGTLIFALAERDQRGRAEHNAEKALAAGKLAEVRLEAAVKATREAEQARKDALEDAAAAREVADFMGGLFEVADPYVISGRILGEQPNSNPSAMDIVNRGAARLADPDTFKTKPLVRANLLDKVGHVYMSRGLEAKAGPFVIEALELRKKHLPAVHPDLASSLHNVGFLHLTKGNNRNSKELFRAAFEMRAVIWRQERAGDGQPASSRDRAYQAPR